MTMLSVLTQAHDRLTRFGFHLGGAALCGIVLSYWIEVVARYFFNSPTLWSTSVIAYCLCIAASLAMPELARRQGHIAITALQEQMSGACRRRYERVIALITGIICLVAAWMLVSETLRQFSSGTTTAMGLSIPKFWISAFIGYGFTGTALYFLRRCFWPDSVEWPHDSIEQGTD